mgnify:CR=1 FL=1
MIIDLNKAKFWGIKTWECGNCSKDVNISDVNEHMIIVYNEIDEAEDIYCNECIKDMD